ncbi:MAG: penicillin-binding protein 2 [Sedimentisphaerales bacterium]|jgi:cell division protein FtsI (penicillin-binding protein 3)
MKNIRVLIALFCFLIAVFLALAARCFYLQYFKNDYFSAECARQQQAVTTILPQRGVIMDCRGRVLAASSQTQTVFVEPRVLQDPKDTSTELAPILDMGAHVICKLITDSANPGFAKIKVGVDPNQATAAGKIFGVGVAYDWQRYYPMGNLASQIVGFTSTDNRGLTGIELEYDKDLAGSAGRNVFIADAFRRPIRLKQHEADVTDGVGIILTIDSTIQQFTRAELLEQYKNFRAESAVAIVAEPKTGAILAMVSLPDFDPEHFNIADPNNLRNRAITDQFEPGSLIKPIVMAVALDDKIVNLTEKIFCENGSYCGKGFGCISEYRNGFGNLTVREILVNSSNIGMAKVGQRMGKDELYNGLKIFGFGEETGIDLPGEVPGVLWPPDKWTGYSVTRIPFGQEITVTAMQLMRAFCILANGGYPVRPYLVRAIVDNEGNIIKMPQPPSQVAYCVDPKVAKWIVTEALTGVINEGTGKKAKLKKWHVFGKTGTANIAKTGERGYAEHAYVASFIAGAPVEDPAVIVLVSIRKPDMSLGKGYTGGALAAPVVGRILEKTLTYLENNHSASLSPNYLAAK